MRGRLVSEGLSLSILSLAGDQRQLPCGDDYKEYVVHLDSGFAIYCITLLRSRESSIAWSLLLAMPFQRLLSVDVTSPYFLAAAATQGVLDDLDSVIAASIATRVTEIYDDEAIC